MHFELFQIARAPKDLPPWELIIDDLGKPSAVQIARTLDVGVSTIFRWQQTGKMPRSAVLALFWLTRWGHSLIHTSATNDAVYYANLCRALHLERAGLKAHVELLGRQRDKLSHQVAHFAALAQGLEPAALDIEGAEHDGGLSQAETFRKVLLAPSGESRHRRPTSTPAAPIDRRAAAGVATVSGPAGTGAEDSAARWTPEDGQEDPAAPRWPEQPGRSLNDSAPAAGPRNLATDEKPNSRSLGHELPAVAYGAADPADTSGASLHRSAGVMTWPGAASAAPLQRPQAASLGVNPQPPKSTARQVDGSTSAAVFHALVKTTTSPAATRRAKTTAPSEAQATRNESTAQDQQ